MGQSIRAYYDKNVTLNKITCRFISSITGTTQVKGANNCHWNWIMRVLSSGKETVRSCASIIKLPIYIWGEAILIFYYNLSN